MTGRAEDYERSMAFADIALGQIKALRQAATPRNYEIWYTYASGYHPALNQQVNATLKAKGTISEADLIQIYESHLSPSRLTERIDQVGSQVKGEIDQVMAMIDTAVGSASSYTESSCRCDRAAWAFEGPRGSARHCREFGANDEDNGDLQSAIGRTAQCFQAGNLRAPRES